MMDKARFQTDRRLKKMEKEIGRVYNDSPAILRIQRILLKYMAMVKERTQDAYDDYMLEEDKDIKEKKKKAYMNEIRKLTLDSPDYRKIVKEFTQVLAKVNQEALDISNDAMVDVYVVNYNQVAEECKKVGIEVGEE